MLVYLFIYLLQCPKALGGHKKVSADCPNSVSLVSHRSQVRFCSSFALFLFVLVFPSSPSSLLFSLFLSLSLSIALFLRSGFDRCGCRGWKKQSARACVRACVLCAREEIVGVVGESSWQTKRAGRNRPPRKLPLNAVSRVVRWVSSLCCEY